VDAAGEGPDQCEASGGREQTAGSGQQGRGITPTKIIAVGVARGTLKLRCFGAPAFTEAIRAAVRASGGRSL